MALYISYKCLSHPEAGKRGAVGWGSFMSYKWNYFGEMLRRPDLSVHVPLASSVWQGRDLHCFNLAEQLIVTAALTPCNLSLGLSWLSGIPLCQPQISHWLLTSEFAPNRAPGELCMEESLVHVLSAGLRLEGELPPAPSKDSAGSTDTGERICEELVTG